MKILFIIAESDEEKPAYFKTEAVKGGIFVIDDSKMKEKEFYGKLLFEIERAIDNIKDKKYLAMQQSKKKPKPSKTKKK